jgi:hypothetical protein
MTIKELCNKLDCCGNCPFKNACEWLDCNPPFENTEDVDKAITKSIIETARILQEDKNND